MSRLLVACSIITLSLAPAWAAVDPAKAPYQAAQQLAAQNQPQQALVKLQEAIRLNPQWQDSYLELATLYRQMGDLAIARQTLEGAKRLNPKRARIYGELGQIAFLDANWSEAEIALQEAVRLYPQYSLAYAHLGELYLRRNERDRATKMAQKALAFGKSDEATAIAHFTLAMAASDPTERARQLQIAINQKNITSARRIEILTVMASQNTLLDMSDAYAYYDQALDLASTSQWPLDQKVRASLINRLIETANQTPPDTKNSLLGTLVNKLETLMKSNPQESAYSDGLLDTFHAMGQYEYMIAEYRRQMLDPQAPKAKLFREMGETYIELDQPQLAVDALQRAHELNPNDESVLANLGGLLISQKRFKEAEGVIAKSLTANPNNSLAHFQQGMIHYLREDWEKAAKSFKAAGINPSPMVQLMQNLLVYQEKEKGSLDFRSVFSAFR